MKKDELHVGMELEAFSPIAKTWLPAVVVDVRNWGGDPLVCVRTECPGSTFCTSLRTLDDLRMQSSKQISKGMDGYEQIAEWARNALS